MEQKKIEKGFLTCVILATVILVFFTRGITLGHNISLHPDEHVFYFGANSLLNAILHPGVEFQEIMEYPEGSYYFYALFQLVGKVFSALLGVEQNLPLWGRIGAVCYFTAGVLLGIRIMARYLGKYRSSVVLYGMIMVFSLFFLEQSRYGTGDPITVMLLMLLINLTARALQPGAHGSWWVATFFVCGVLGAVKYPLLVFLIIPGWCYLRLSGRRGLPGLIVLLLVSVCGFLLFSPKGMLEADYFLRVLQRESGAYVTSTGGHEAGGPWNHLAVLLIYGILYSDFSLLLPVTVRRFFFRQKSALSHTDFLFQVVLPITCGLFFAYNLFTSTLYFRTYVPFFTLITLYTASAAGELLQRKRGKAWFIIALSIIMVLRGGCLVWALTDPVNVSEKVARQISGSVDENWTETYLTSVFTLTSEEIYTQDLPVYESVYLDPLLENNGGNPEIRPGQLVITGAYGYHLGADYLLPVNNESDVQIKNWEAFQLANQPYLAGQAYPDSYYYLFGGWLRGGTLSQYEFPVNYIYYRS